MSKLYFTKHIIIFLLLFQLLGLVFINQGITQEQNTTLSGQIINLQGEPIPNARIVLVYFKYNDLQTIIPLYDIKLYPFLPGFEYMYNRGKFPDITNTNELPPYLESITDADGKFSFTNIASNMVQLIVLSKHMPEINVNPEEERQGRRKVEHLPIIHSIQFNKTTFYPHQYKRFPPVGAVTFTIDPGSNIENVQVKVTMEHPLNIRGRIVFKNGEPLSDKSITIHVANNLPNHPYGPVSIKTDENGFFTQNLYSVGIYAISVVYRGLSVISEPFLLNGNEPHEVIELAFDSNPDDLNILDTDNENTKQTPSIYDLLIHDLLSQGAWILNPENGHQYKRIVCKTREDAQIQANQQDAHLVTITSDKEQVWLESVFTTTYWIGLTRHKDVDKWVWDTGEPIRYKNWSKNDYRKRPSFIPRMFGNYAVMQRDYNGDMKWSMVDQKHSEHGYTRIAVIEKE